jgi:hypothetical protein
MRFTPRWVDGRLESNFDPTGEYDCPVAMTPDSLKTGIVRP